MAFQINFTSDDLGNLSPGMIPAYNDSSTLDESLPLFIRVEGADDPDTGGGVDNPA